MRGLNLACGEHADVAGEGWVNLDRYNMEHWRRPPDVIADLLQGLPFQDSTFDRIYIGHLMEHLDVGPELRALFDEVIRVGKPDAEVGIVGPCMDRAIAEHQPDWLLDIIRADTVFDQPKGIQHRWTSTGSRSLTLVREYLDYDAQERFPRELAPPDWPNPSIATWQFAIYAQVVKP